MAAVSIQSCSIGTSTGLVHVSVYNAALRFQIEQLERVTGHELDKPSWRAFGNCSGEADQPLVSSLISATFAMGLHCF
jgi:hypothetical protein